VLNKKICQKCYEANGETWSDYQDQLWEGKMSWTGISIGRRVSCPFHIFASADSKIPIGKVSQNVEKPNYNRCPYHLEHELENAE